MRQISMAAAIVCVMALLCVAMAWAALIWEVETIYEGDWLRHSSIAIDSAGHPHISAVNNPDTSLSYIAWTGTEWDIQTVDSTGRPFQTSIALDTDEHPYIAYQDSENCQMRCAIWNGTSWDIHTIDTGTDPNIGGGCDRRIALDSSDRLYIAYRDPSSGSGQLKCAWYDGLTWTIQTVGVEGRYCSLALDDEGRPHISYTDGGLCCAVWNGTDWDIDTSIDTGGYGWTSIALDDAGNPHISYRCGDGWDWPYELRCATWTGTAWSVQTVDSQSSSGSGGNSIAIGSDGYPRISYQNYDHGDLRYAAWNGSDWSIENVAACSGDRMSLGLDPWDYPHISYGGFSDELDHVLKYAGGHSPLAVRWPR